MGLKGKERRMDMIKEPLIRAMTTKDLDRIAEIDTKILGQPRREFWEMRLDFIFLNPVTEVKQKPRRSLKNSLMSIQLWEARASCCRDRLEWVNHEKVFIRF